MIKLVWTRQNVLPIKVIRHVLVLTRIERQVHAHSHTHTCSHTLPPSLTLFLFATLFSFALLRAEKSKNNRSLAAQTKTALLHWTLALPVKMKFGNEKNKNKIKIK